MNTKIRVPTAFEERVYAAIRRIPRGKVTTYKHLAAALGCGSSQAVGQALKRNPYAPEAPCHRVIASTLTIGGFAGHTEGDEIRRKFRMLAEEGVDFVEGRLANDAQVHVFPEAR
jgi:methylated-DNA-[protein]-cysteine S-methyltransferase